jgi:hypothetical protein
MRFSPGYDGSPDAFKATWLESTVDYWRQKIRRLLRVFAR